MTKKDFITLSSKAILAGLLIGCAACIYMSCDNKYIGALLFSLGLYAVCELDAKLFTGVVGNINSNRDILNALIILFYNICAAALCGALFKFCVGSRDVFEKVVYTQTWYTVLFESCTCGALIYISVTIYKQTKNPIVLIIGVMGFILSNSLHSIACSTYIMLGNITFKSVLYLLLIIIGNSIGALTIRALYKGFKTFNKNNS